MSPKRSASQGANKPPLTNTKSWVRIRPIGDLGHKDGDACEKQLGKFDEKAIKIISHDQGGKEVPYDYMSRVFPVDCTQEQVGEEILPGLLEDFWSDTNVVIFAYGQTGTGKTHTMFGRAESLTMTNDNPGWGLMPRAVHATLGQIAERKAQGVESILLLSAVEFYVFQCYDLADKAGKQLCTMKGSQVFGNSYQQCDTPADLAEFLDRVYGNRMVCATAMNAGSSRSHTVVTLTLMTLDKNTDSFKETKFSIVDLAGAERPEKASHKGERITKDKAMMELYSYFKKGMQGTLSLELQGFLINFELSDLLAEVVVASDMNKNGREYKNKNNFMLGATTQFFGGALAGQSRLGALICLSQSPQNGWETWYSIHHYGKELSKLKTRVAKVASASSAKALTQAEKDAQDAATALANQGSSASAMKYAAFRFGMKVYTEQRLHFMQKLFEKKDAGSAPAASVSSAGAALAPASSSGGAAEKVE